MPVPRTLLPAIVAAVLSSPHPTRAQEADPSLRLTTETLEYCHFLSRRLDAMPGHLQAGPRRLGQEGRRLCAHGHVRTGIARLRRAIRLAVAPHPQGG